MKSNKPQSVRKPGVAVCLVLVAIVAIAPEAQGKIFQPQLLDGETYSETYTAVADMDDGTYILTQFLFSNAGLGDGKAACRVLIVPKGGKGSNAASHYDRDEWSWSEGEGLRAGPCSLSTQGGKTRFVAQADRMRVTLDLHRKARKIRPPGHRIKLKEAFYDSEVLIPWSRATAKIHAPGAPKGTLKGNAYLDHTRSTALVPDLATRWIRFRGLKGERPTLIQIRNPPRGGKARGWVWSKGEKKITRLKSEEFTAEQSGDSFTLTVQTEQGPLKVSSSKTLFRYEPVKQYGVLGALAKSWVGNPLTTTWRASLERPSGERVDGILEVGLTRK